MVTIMPLWRASSRISKRKGSILHIRSLDEAQRQIEEYIHFYNHNQPQRKAKKAAVSSVLNYDPRDGHFKKSASFGFFAFIIEFIYRERSMSMRYSEL
ncbi:hypothetical protein ABE142_25185, partial [Paenibacillus alvei]|uniref:hypothetical protein n=1 Tax=Paenibacillus alvei TaxID=44250 RepID=UPI003D2DA514